MSGRRPVRIKDQDNAGGGKLIKKNHSSSKLYAGRRKKNNNSSFRDHFQSNVNNLSRDPGVK